LRQTKEQTIFRFCSVERRGSEYKVVEAEKMNGGWGHDMKDKNIIVYLAYHMIDG